MPTFGQFFEKLMVVEGGGQSRPDAQAVVSVVWVSSSIQFRSVFAWKNGLNPYTREGRHVLTIRATRRRREFLLASILAEIHTTTYTAAVYVGDTA
jgi:hypothetical protein